MKKPRIYVDMDGVLCNYMAMHREVLLRSPGMEWPQASYGFFRNMEPMEGALKAYDFLHKNFDTWILTRPSIMNPLCYTEKRDWVEEHLGIEVCHKFIICPEKSLLKGDYLIDDMDWPLFEGVHLKFGGNEWPDWNVVVDHFKKEYGGVAQTVEQRLPESPRVGDSSAPPSANSFVNSFSREEIKKELKRCLKLLGYFSKSK